MFFWKGKAQNEDRIHGVGFAIKSNLLKQNPGLSTGVSERLIKIHLPVSNKCFVTIIRAYASNMTSTEETKEQFYADLDTLLCSTPANDKLILLGDVNARVGRDSDQWRGVTGKHRVWKINSNRILLRKCAEYDLLITNTMFRLDDTYKTTWMHPRSKQWHLNDYVITRHYYNTDVLITRAMFSANYWTDHRLV